MAYIEVERAVLFAKSSINFELTALPKPARIPFLKELRAEIKRMIEALK